MTLEQFSRRAIGVPFIPFGRDFDGWDCYGLLVVAWREIVGLELPDFVYDSVNNYRLLNSLFSERSTTYWQRVDRGKPMTCAAIYRRGLIIHTGLVVPGRRILHVEQGIETCAEPIGNFRIEGFYAPCSGATSIQNRND